MPITHLHPLPGGPPRPPVLVAPRVHRDAVAALLTEAESTSVSIVHAPRGFGKTDALWAWASTTHLDVAWLELPKDASQEQHVALLRSAASWLRASGSDQRAAHRSALVVDGLSFTGSDAIQAELVPLAMTGGSRLVISTNERMPPELLASLGLVEPLVSHHELAFTDAEAASLARMLAAPGTDPLPAGTLTSIRRATGGWPLGLRLVLHRARASSTSAWNDMRDLTHHVAGHLVGDLQRHPGYASLVLAAVPDKFPEHAIALLADPTLLDDAERHGLGTWVYDGPKRSFVFQPLIRDFLRDGASEVFEQQTMVSIARVHMRDGRVKAAFAAAVRGLDWPLAQECASMDLIEVTALMSDEPQLLARVPKSVLRRAPLLNMLAALGLYIQGRMGSAMLAFGTMVADVERTRILTRSEPQSEHVWVQGMLMVGLRVLGRYELVRPALRRCIAMLETVTQVSTELDHAEDLFYTEASVTAMQLADTAAAIELLERRPLRAARTKRQHFYGSALHLQALVAHGEIRAARDHCAEFEARVLPPHFAESFYAIPWHIAKAYLHLEAGDAKAADAVLAHTDRHWATAENWPFILLARTDVRWADEGAHAALRTFTELRDEQSHRAPVSHGVDALFTAKLAQLLAAAGQRTDAMHLLPRRPNEPVTAGTRSLLLVLTGSVSAGLEDAEQLLQRRNRTIRRTLEMHIVAALAAHRLGDERRRAHHARRAETLSLRSGLRSPFAFVNVDERGEVFSGSAQMAEWVEGVPSFFDAPMTRPTLTKKETFALHELAQGESMIESAQKRSVSLNTVKSQRRSLYRKLGVTGASEAVHRARELGLL